MTVLLREDEGFDAAGAAVQRVLQTLGDEVEHAVAVGQPAAVEPLKPSCLEGPFCVVEVLRIGWLPAALGDLPALVKIAAHLTDQRRSQRRGDLLSDRLRIQLAEALRPRRDDDAKGPRGHAAQQLEMPLDEYVAGTQLGVGREVQENYPAVRIDADRELLRDDSTSV